MGSEARPQVCGYEDGTEKADRAVCMVLGGTLANYTVVSEVRWHRPHDVLLMGIHINHRHWGLCHLLSIPNYFWGGLGGMSRCVTHGGGHPILPAWIVYGPTPRVAVALRFRAWEARFLDKRL